MANYGTQNLLHVISEQACTDPDCEIHNPDVGLREEVVTLTDAAFFLAGAQALIKAAGDSEALDDAFKTVRTKILEAIG